MDIADRDYIAARILWRTRLPGQFLWSALQAIEKQFKAILVFNGRSAKGLRHNVAKSLEAVCDIQDLHFDPPEQIRKFVIYLNIHAPNRYLERPFYLRGAELFELDRAFWHFRRYCQDFRSTAQYVGTTEAEWLKLHRDWFMDPKHQEAPFRYRLGGGGYLESVLDGKQGREQYTAIVWKNIYYGKRDKGTIQYQPLSWMANPAHVRHPDVFAELAELMDFPKDVKTSLGQQGKGTKAGRRAGRQEPQ